ncbi:pilus assembly protein TadG-related protein [Nocardioides sp. TRM66260-LWL]|uniref:pilus assembly protein TadG-related protein n=1 Tax=Nocardioides sp. TRM66260-LWL TaxID=2874478 RepID=UPI001CC4F408|nr:pilus assembly protein TadG-related protein [Nocardioides sp. TRM66260-LWL]MBZ5732904.1 pilus assembly protein TadG-related protein [Nocardioides sp. TRM66260-LWL]
MRGEQRPRADDGSVIPLIVGFALVLVLAIALVVDATAAFLHRQSLDNLADGAALQAADLGAAGRAYQGGVPGERLAVDPASAREAVAAFLDDAGVAERYPGLRFAVEVRPDEVVVTVSAPLDLPLRLPGAASRPRIVARGAAVTVVDP